MHSVNNWNKHIISKTMHFKWKGKKLVGMDRNSHNLSSPLLISTAYKSLHSSFCLFKTWRKKEIADTNSATKVWILRKSKKSKTFFYTPRWEDWWLGKMKFITYIPPQIHFLTFIISHTINLCAWGQGVHSGAVHVFRPAALQSQTDAPHSSAVLEGTC